jgi:hypothetical protein
MLDPFEVILDRARNGENIVSEIKSLYAKQDELRQAVANLEREEKKAKPGYALPERQSSSQKTT